MAESGKQLLGKVQTPMPLIVMSSLDVFCEPVVCVGRVNAESNQ
jgi:hypothetical protein